MAARNSCQMNTRTRKIKCIKISAVSPYSSFLQETWKILENFWFIYAEKHALARNARQLILEKDSIMLQNTSHYLAFLKRKKTVCQKFYNHRVLQLNCDASANRIHVGWFCFSSLKGAGFSKSSGNVLVLDSAFPNFLFVYNYSEISALYLIQPNNFLRN